MFNFSMVFSKDLSHKLDLSGSGLTCSSFHIAVGRETGVKQPIMSTLNELRYGRKQEADDPTLVPKDVEKSTFFSSSIPEEVKRMAPLLHSLSLETVANIIEKDHEIVDNEEGDSMFTELAEAVDIEADTLSNVLSGLRSIKRYVLKNKIVPEIVSQDLVRMNIPQGVVDRFMSRLKEIRKVT